VLQNTAILRKTQITSSRWTHFGLMVIKEGCNKVTQLQPLEDWQNIHKTNLYHVFNQLKVMVSHEVNELGDSGMTSATLNTALQNVIKEYKGFKSGESERSVVIITLRWEGYVKDEIREFCHYGMEAISNLKIIEITGYENRFTYTDRIHVDSLPIKGLDIAAEALFKSWLKDTPCRFVICLRSDSKDMEIVTFAENVMIELDTMMNSGGKCATPTRLTILSFIPTGSVCQTKLYGKCQLLTAKGTKIENYYRFTALSRFMIDKGVAAVLQGSGSSNMCFKMILVSGSQEKIMVQPIITEEFVNSSSNLMASFPDHTNNEVNEIARKIPILHDYGLGSQIKLLDYLKHNSMDVIKGSVTGNKVARTVRQHVSAGHAHPALGMYQERNK